MRTKIVSYSDGIYDAIINAVRSAVTGQGIFPDFSNFLVIVPGRQWMRNLKDAFADAFPNGVCPPKILTPGTALHYKSDAVQSVSSCKQAVLWEKAARKHVSDLNRIFPDRSRELNDYDFENMAKVLSSLRLELVKNGLTINGASSVLAQEDERWFFLARLETHFLDELKLLGIPDPAETDRKDASDARSLAADFEKIFICFVPDLPLLLQKKLETLEDITTVLIHASDEESFLFDKWGRPSEEWNGKRLPVEKDRLHCVADVRQAARLALEIATDGGRRPFSPSRCAMALARPSFFADFASEFSLLDFEDGTQVRLFSPEGMSGRKLRISRLLSAVFFFLQKMDDFDAFSSLLRNGDFLSLLLRGTEFTENEFLSVLDSFMLDAMPDDTYNAAAFAEKSVGNDFALVLRNALSLLEKFSSSADFCTDLKYFLKDVFSQEEDYPPVYGIAFDDEELYWRNAIDLFSRSPVKSVLPSAAGQLKLLLDESGNTVFYPEHDGNAVSVYNFLELPALKQDELFLVGVNNGVFPSLPPTTPFLTDAIRKKLGFPCRDHLTALETYKLSALMREDRRVHLIVLASDEDANPLRPSEMLFQGCGDELLSDRAKTCLNPERVAELSAVQGGKNGHFKLNLKNVSESDFFKREPLALSVTDFKSYMNSPTAFLLQKACRIECPDYEARELADNDFGTACHKGFEKLLNADCQTEDEYFKTMREGAYAFLRRKCGMPLPLLISLQFKQIEELLRPAARLLASGKAFYRLLEAEYRLNGGEGVTYCGAVIRGTIDRIELSSDGRTLRLLDVKTYNKTRTPENDHLAGRGKNKYLTNLQLPLYVILLKKDASFWEKHGLDPHKTRIEVGYFLMTADSPDAKIVLWDTYGDYLDKAEKSVQTIVEELQTIKEKCILPPEPSGASYYGLEGLLLPNATEAAAQRRRKKND